MKTLITLAVAVIVGLSTLGCGQESKQKTQTTTSTPEGSTTTTKETKVETKGDNPPPAKE